MGRHPTIWDARHSFLHRILLRISPDRSQGRFQDLFFLIFSWTCFNFVEKSENPIEKQFHTANEHQGSAVEPAGLPRPPWGLMGPTGPIGPRHYIYFLFELAHPTPRSHHPIASINIGGAIPSPNAMTYFTSSFGGAMPRLSLHPYAHVSSACIHMRT